MSDRNHCGDCGSVCGTGMCAAGVCLDGTFGHAVLIGMDYAGVTTPSAASTVLGNAMFLAEGTKIEVARFRAFVDAEGHGSEGVSKAIEHEAAERARVVQAHDALTADEVLDDLVGGELDVLIVEDQPAAPAGELANIGAQWAGPMQAFLEKGGVVIVLVTNAGRGEMRQLLASSTLLGTSATIDVGGSTLFDWGWLDAVGQGIVGPFIAPPGAVSFIPLEPESGLFASVIGTASGAPVVLHKVWVGP
jgi:hypothetical protein